MPKVSPYEVTYTNGQKRVKLLDDSGAEKLRKAPGVAEVKLRTSARNKARSIRKSKSN